MSNDPPRNADPRLLPATGRTGLATLLVAGALSAIIFGSRVVLQEIQSEPDMMGYSTIRRAGMIWDEAMRYVRATKLGAKLHEETRKVEEARF